MHVVSSEEGNARRSRQTHHLGEQASVFRAAVQFGEHTGWMPPIAPDVWPWAYDQLPALVAAYDAEKVGTYFPLVRVNE